jgi:hypothetical protein
VVPNVNIGAIFYDIEFTREIPRGRPRVEENQVQVEQVDQNRLDMERIPPSGHTLKRSRIDTSGHAERGNQSAPGGFMRDARTSYKTLCPAAKC